MVEDRTGEVVDHQHLPLQRVLDEERHTVQPLALLESHTHVRTRDTNAYAYTHTHAHTQGTQAGRAELQRRRPPKKKKKNNKTNKNKTMCTCGHARTENTQGNAYTIGRVIKTAKKGCCTQSCYTAHSHTPTHRLKHYGCPDPISMSDIGLISAKKK